MAKARKGAQRRRWRARAAPAGFALCFVLTGHVSFTCSQSADPDESRRIAEVLEVAEGSRLADLGAGDGRWTFDFAARVGAPGMVFATEVDADKVENLEREVERRGLTNVRVLSGDQNRTGLPADCCAGILVREVYHHFTNPAAMLADLYAALRPGGLIAVIDFEPGSRGLRTPSGVPANRGGHGISRKLVIEEMEKSGFVRVSEIEDWGGRRFCVVFRRPGG
jgi:predicted methyltransferase